MANELTIFIDADTSGLQQGLAQAEREANNFQSRIQGIADVGQKMAGLGAVITAGLTVPIVGLAIASIKAYGEIQSLQKGLEAVAGSATLAEQQFNDLKQVAKLPGLGLQEAVKGSINLQAIGISASKAENILLQFGNAVATVGKGRAEFERAIYGVQQLANTDFPLGEDLNIIKDAIPQVSRLLTEAFGANRSDELAKMGVSSKQVLDVILVGLGKLPRVTGGIKGAFENMGDSIQQSLARIGKVIDDNLDISGIVDKITEYVDKAVSAFESLDPTLQKVILGIAGVTAVAGPLLLAVGGFMAILPTLTAGIAGIGALFGALLSPIGLVTVALVGVVTAVVANWDKIRPYLVDTLERFKRLYSESAIFRHGIITLGASIEGFARSSVVVLGVFYKNFVDFGKAVLNIFKGIGNGIEGTLTFNTEKIKEGFIGVMGAPLTYLSDMTRNSLSALDEIKKISDDAIKKWSSLDVKNWQVPKTLGLELEKEVSNGITKGVTKIKPPEKKIAEEINPFKFVGGFDPSEEYKRIYKNVADFALFQSELSRKIIVKDLPNNISEGASLALAEMMLFNEKMRHAVEELNESLTSIVNNNIVDGISDAFASIGTALANGENVFKSLGQSLLGSFGKILSELGKQLIQYGVGLLAIKVAMKSLNPYVAIAAGAALVALGAGVTASVANQSNSIGGGGNSGVSTSTGSSANQNFSSNYTNASGSGSGEVIFRISGTDLVGAFNRSVIASDRVNTI